MGGVSGLSGIILLLLPYSWWSPDPSRSLAEVLEQIAIVDEDAAIGAPSSIMQVSLLKDLDSGPRPEYSDWCELDTVRHEFFRTTGVRIELLDEHSDLSGGITARPCRTENAPGILRLVRTVSVPLRFYRPQVLTERMGLCKVLICEDLRLKGIPIKGTADAKTGSLYLSLDVENHVDLGPGWSGMMFHCVHHELFHLIEGKLRERLGDEFKYWETLHGRTWKFGIHALDSTATKQEAARVKYLRHDLDGDGLLDYDTPVMNNPRFRILGDGILTRYSKGSVREDRAELYAALMFCPASRRLAFEAAENDRLIRTKLILLELTLQALVQDSLQ